MKTKVKDKTSFKRAKSKYIRNLRNDSVRNVATDKEPYGNFTTANDMRGVNYEGGNNVKSRFYYKTEFGSSNLGRIRANSIYSGVYGDSSSEIPEITDESPYLIK